MPEWLQTYYQSLVQGDLPVLLSTIAAVIAIVGVLFGWPKWLIDKIRGRTTGDRLGRIEKQTENLPEMKQGGAVAYESTRALAEKLIEQSSAAARAADKTTSLEQDLQSKQQEIEALTRTIEELKAGARAARPGMTEALAALERGETDEAEALFDAIAEARIAEGTVANKEAAQALRNKGNLLFLHDTQGAMRAFAKAAELDPDDPEGWNELGHLQSRVGDLDAAQRSYERVLALGNQLDDQTWIAATYCNLGILYATRGDLDQAEAMHKKSLAIEEALGHKEGMAIATGNLGILYQTRGDLDQAEAMYKKSLAIDEALDRKEGMASNYGNLGILYRTRGDLDRAEAMHKKSLAIEEALGRKEGMANQYGNLGNVYYTRGDLDQAEAMYKKSLAISEALGRKQGMASDYGNLGILYEQKGDIAQACAHWRKARDLFTQIGMKPQLEQVEGRLREAGC